MNRVMRRVNLIDPSEPEVTFVSAPPAGLSSEERVKRAARERRQSYGRKRKKNKKHGDAQVTGRISRKGNVQDHVTPLPPWGKGGALWRRLNRKKNRARGRGSRGGTVSVHPNYANRGPARRGH